MPLKPIRWYKYLTSHRGRRESGVFVVEGEKAIRQISENHPDAITEIISIESLSKRFPNYPVRTVTDKQFNSISSVKTPQGIMAIVKKPTGAETDELPADAGTQIVLLEDIQDPGNVGTIIRTAVAFGFKGILFSSKCADPFSPKCVQSTAGTVYSIWIRRTPNYLKLAYDLKKNGFSLVVADANSSSGTGILTSNDRLILGLCNESSGPSDELINLADYVVGIPIDRTKAESLNVAISGAICMYLTSMASREDTNI